MLQKFVTSLIRPLNDCSITRPLEVCMQTNFNVVDYPFKCQLSFAYCIVSLVCDCITDRCTGSKTKVQGHSPSRGLQENEGPQNLRYFIKL